MFLIEEPSSSDIQRFRRDGFLVVERLIEPEAAAHLATRFGPLFRGEFETGLCPDEWNWREGRDAADLTRQICNAWKSDRHVAAHGPSSPRRPLVCAAQWLAGRADQPGQRSVPMIDIVGVCRYQLRMTGQDLYREIGRRIRRLRKAAGQTQEQLATQVGVSRASIANIEAGRQNFLLHNIYAIAEALDLGTPVSLLPGSHEGVTPAIDTAEGAASSRRPYRQTAGRG